MTDIPSRLDRTPWATGTSSNKLGSPNSNPVINNTAVQFDPVGEADYSMEYNSFAGSDIIVTLFMPPPEVQSIRDAGEGGVAGAGVIKVTAELQTMTISSARSVQPVRRLGEVAPANYTRGGRTIAGSMIFTTLFRDAFAEAYQRAYDETEVDMSNFFVDQLPRFNMQIAAANEYGHIANSVLTNIHLTNFGTTLSVDDLYTEATYTYVAENFYPFVEDTVQMQRWLTNFSYAESLSDTVKREALRRNSINNAPVGGETPQSATDDDILDIVSRTMDHRYPQGGISL